jgi:hypothetical protein
MVSPNQPFTVTASVGGVVAKIAVTATGLATLTVGTAATLGLTVTAQDADGNTIIGAAPFASPVTLTDSDTSGATSLAPGSVTAPGTAVTLTYTGATLSVSSITIGATAAGVSAGNSTPLQVAVNGGGGPCTQPASNLNRLYVANDGGDNDLQFTTPYTGTPVALSAIGNPVWIGFSPLSPNLFSSAFGSSAGVSSGGAVEEFTPPYTGAFITAIGNGVVQGPRGFAFDSTGNIYIADQGGGRIIKYAPPYTGTPTFPVTGVAPYGVAFDPPCNLYITNNTEVLEYAPPYTGAAVKTISNGLTSADGIAFDSASNMYVTDGNASAVVVYAPPYTGAPSQVISLTGGAGPIGLAFDGNQNLFVNEYNISRIVEYAPPYTGAPIVTISSGLSLNADVSFGP